jgi:predicted dehydrogenase
LLVKASRKYQKLVQMGNQRRSIKFVKQMIDQIADGLIGRIYLAKCFYTRNRPPIGYGKKIEVPDYLDWNLWQGPAPRVAYRDNVHPYNWHWFWQWGTGEALNNGVHMLDIARGAVKLDYPIKVSSSGGRWHHVGVDDWQCPDTQEIQLEFEGGKMITWFGRSTNTHKQGYKGFGILFFGTEGIIDYDGGYTYHIYDMDNKLIKTVDNTSLSKKVDQTNLQDPGLRDRHAENFIQSIRGLEKLNAPIDQGHKSTLLGHLGNISLRVGRTLQLNKQNGHILNDTEAAKLWKRAYEPGWEPTV